MIDLQLQANKEYLTVIFKLSFFRITDYFLNISVKTAKLDDSRLQSYDT